MPTGSEGLASLAALLGADAVPHLWFGGREVASPGLEGGQVAVLRLYAAVCWPRNAYIILLCEGWRITQLQYLLRLSWWTSEKAVYAKFAE